MKGFIIKRSKKRTFKEIRKTILKSLSEPKSITQISREIETSWVTARRHLQWLAFTKKIKPVEKGGRKFYIKC